MKKPGPVVDAILGTAFICGQKNGAYISLTPDQLDYYHNLFRYPERLILDHETIKAEPYLPAAKAPSIVSQITSADIRRSDQDIQDTGKRCTTSLER